jgi:hypothetical protein
MNTCNKLNDVLACLGRKHTFMQGKNKNATFTITGGSMYVIIIIHWCNIEKG